MWDTCVFRVSRCWFVIVGLKGSGFRAWCLYTWGQDLGLLLVSWYGGFRTTGYRV